MIGADGQTNARADSDEAYVVGLVSTVLGEEPRVQHRFDWLVGDTGRRLPVDAYFPGAGIVLEYRELQHRAERPDSFKLWDNKMTASGMTRREQRKRYDALREREIPKHGFRLLIVEPSDLSHDSRGRLLRSVDSDRAALKQLIAAS